MKINIIFGPPGTGKTTRLLEILEKELQEYRPEEIAYVSFTKEGANQGKNRSIKQFGLKEKSFPYFRTLHSLAFRELHLTRDQVINKRYYKMFSNKMKMNFTGYYTEDLKNNDDRYLLFNLLHRNNPKIASSYLYDLNTDLVQFVNKNYRRFKEFYQIIDFTDMIELFNKRQKAIPVKVALIDEAQDLTTLQWTMIWIAFRNCETVYIAGDDDQAIYEWSGADVNYFLGLEGSIEILTHSYRLPDNIVIFAKRIASLIQKRIDKNYHGTGLIGNMEWVLGLEEIKITSNETWMFLSRNHCFLQKIVEYIQSQGLIYTLNGELSVNEKDIKAINLFEKIRRTNKMGKKEALLLRSFIKQNYDLRNPWYNNFEWEEKKIKYYRDIIFHKTDIHVCKIKINTIHSVKGDEADNVVILLDITKQVYINLQNNNDSEYRVFYVGCTRTKKKLFIVEAESPYKYEILNKWRSE
ncbi:hypothetical protein LCGC14_0521380 [marine sediment metagenome]|uniref:UvrD-like helicase ATP-binding domain-containing protein n=1 Tax=marine sediment metagenome TaxID=412755 RepID=A0A0F9V6I8_9ZZZZ